jgi:hypothetical protein
MKKIVPEIHQKSDHKIEEIRSKFSEMSVQKTKKKNRF